MSPYRLLAVLLFVALAAACAGIPTPTGVQPNYPNPND